MSGAVGTAVEALDTPAVVVDLDVFEANLRRMTARLGGRVALRPHLKTAKAPDVARRLLDAGAVGVCVAKLGEAEVMLAAGVPDVLVTTELVGPAKVARLARLVRSHPAQRIAIVVDDAGPARALDTALAAAGAGPVDTLVDVNVGQDRCGVDPAGAVALAERLRPLARVRVMGVQGYEGHLQHEREPAERRRRCEASMRALDGAVRGLREAGHAIEVVTTGGTGTAEVCAEHDVVTEVQPGSFVFMDADYLDTGGIGYEPALAVLSTVISRPAPDRALVDAGLKSLSDDSGPARPLGTPGWTYHHAGDEHGVLKPDGDAAAGPRIGDTVALLPSHIDTTVNLHDAIHAHRRGVVEEVWPISARGRVR
jgi:D-serine deaminase-like pyridoxal phosphate-dependent protein